jgi:pyrroloquinoline quinone (PQQ) biosynthesis protein C
VFVGCFLRFSEFPSENDKHAFDNIYHSFENFKHDFILHLICWPNVSYYTGMTDATNLTSVTNPQQALQEFSGAQFVAWVSDYVSHQVATWPVLAKIVATAPDPQKLRKFLAQVFLAQQAMWSEKDTEPGFLKFAIANLSESDDPSAEPALEILNHKFNAETAALTRNLWLRLFQSLGLAPEELLRLEPKEATRNYISELSEVYSNFEWQTGLGALVAYWLIVPMEFQAISDLSAGLMNTTDKDWEVVKSFTHYQTQAQTLAHELLEKLSFDPDGRQLIWEGVLRQLSAEQEFLDHIGKYLDD